MATTKTLTPTNQTISIPELSDAPDMSVPADAISKEADAINSLNSKITKLDGSLPYAEGDANSYTTTGIYHVGITQNSPISGTTLYGDLFVQGTGVRITQIFTIYDGSTFIRQRSNATTWSTWGQVALKSDLQDITRPSRQSTSVLTYAVGLSEGIHFYTTSGGVSGNPASSGSFMFIIFRASTGVTILGLPLASRQLYINSSQDNGANYLGWKEFTGV